MGIKDMNGKNVYEILQHITHIDQKELSGLFKVAVEHKNKDSFLKLFEKSKHLIERDNISILQYSISQNYFSIFKEIIDLDLNQVVSKNTDYGQSFFYIIYYKNYEMFEYFLNSESFYNSINSKSFNFIESYYENAIKQIIIKKLPIKFSQKLINSIEINKNNIIKSGLVESAISNNIEVFNYLMSINSEELSFQNNWLLHNLVKGKTKDHEKMALQVFKSEFFSFEEKDYTFILDAIEKNHLNLINYLFTVSEYKKALEANNPDVYKEYYNKFFLNKLEQFG